MCPHLPTEALAASPWALLCLPGTQMPALASLKGPLAPPLPPSNLPKQQPRGRPAWGWEAARKEKQEGEKTTSEGTP